MWNQKCCLCNLPAEKQSSGDCGSSGLEDENETLTEGFKCFLLRSGVVICISLYYIQYLKTTFLVPYD